MRYFIISFAILLVYEGNIYQLLNFSLSVLIQYSNFEMQRQSPTSGFWKFLLFFLSFSQNPPTFSVFLFSFSLISLYPTRWFSDTVAFLCMNDFKRKKTQNTGPRSESAGTSALIAWTSEN